MKPLFASIIILIAYSCTSTKNTTRENTKGETKTLFVAAYKKDCKGVGKQSCYLVKDKPDAEWTLFYNEIKGFDYRAGNEYELKVLVELKDNPPADGSSLDYTLISIESKTVPAWLQSPLYDIWGLKKINGETVNLKTQANTPMIEINTRDNTILGSTGCNQFSSTIKFNDSTQSLKIAFPVAQTKRGCPKGAVEKTFLFFLEKTDSYLRNGNSLYLLSEGVRVMEFGRMD